MENMKSPVRTSDREKRERAETLEANKRRAAEKIGSAALQHAIESGESIEEHALIGSIVTIEFIDYDDGPEAYFLMNEYEYNPESNPSSINTLSTTSVVGKAVIGHKAGDIIEVPAGKIKIISVEK